MLVNVCQWTNRSGALAAHILFRTKVAPAEAFWEGFRERFEYGEAKDGAKERCAKRPASLETEVDATRFTRA